MASKRVLLLLVLVVPAVSEGLCGYQGNQIQCSGPERCSSGNSETGGATCQDYCHNDLDCNDHAESVVYTPADDCREPYWYNRNTCPRSGTCTCNCNDEYAGATCDSCAEGYKNYPGCEQVCTVSGSCSGHAKTVNWQPGDICTCDCTGEWTGKQCETCPSPYDPALDCADCLPGHILYPTCEKCTDAGHCNSRSPSKVDEDGTRKKCICHCLHQWTGDHCEKCPPNFEGDCDACVAGRINYPSCVKCTSETHCNGHARSVTDDGTRNSCKCTCKDGFQAPYCDRCEKGYIGYPACTKCTSENHCNGRAQSVNDDGKRSLCKCTCRNKWEGPSCEKCPAKYGGSDCDQCADDHISFPECRLCTQQDCNNRAEVVSSNADHTLCVCKCKKQWQGKSCQTCPPAYAGQDCDECAPSHIDYPKCIPCSTARHCSGHAAGVTDNGQRTECDCSCNPPWGGERCQTCPAKYAGGSCDRCAESRIKYPTCRLCTSDKDCNGRAEKVTADDSRTSCECDCINSFTGKNCETCPPKYSGELCNKCAARRVEYPKCTECTVEDSCSGRAKKAVSDALQEKCVCTCLPNWEGTRCETCPPQFALPSCDACNDGFINYPKCTKCTNLGACNENAASVDSNPQHSACICTCKADFAGPACEKCSEGRIGYPKCRKCTNKKDCNGRAAEVTDNGSREECSCRCNNQWSQPDCGTCPTRFGGSNCNKCAKGHIEYPTCTLCTTAICNGRGKSAADDGTRSTCVCECENQWTGDTCKTCPEQYGGTQCNECAPGRINFPECRKCDVAVDCNGHADGVEPDSSRTSCVCECRNEWKNPKCSSCAPQYAEDCGKCAVGYINPFPQCVKCDEDVHCSSHAESVTDDGSRTSCRCTCRNQWSGPQCNVCPDKYGGLDCDRCAQGIGYPSCGSCTVPDSCSGHATNVEPNADQTKCVCACIPPWEGTSCQTCPSNYTGTNCDKCALGFINFPECKKCTDADCSGHSASVTSDDKRTSCSCTCENEWAGVTCDTCPEEFEGADCNKCVEGRVSYPQCVPCLNADHCNGRAANVSDDGTRDHCVCTCANQWKGLKCETCPPQYGGVMCDRCAEGHVNYPICEKCTIDDHCSGNAYNVSTEGQESCVCHCQNQWQGLQCETCPYPYEGPSCSSCAPGHIDYPLCTNCTSIDHCSGRASKVTDNGQRTSCTCTCENEWKGPSCNDCPTKYDGDNCDKCGEGRIMFDECTLCDSVVHCNGRADSVGPDSQATSCSCNCTNQWSGAQCQTCPPQFAGSDCDRCAEGWIGYPACRVCHLVADCSGNADVVESDSTHTKCECECRSPWKGGTCNICPQEFNQTTCDRCADGYIGYPNCRKCTSSDCSNHEASVHTDSEQTNCTCECRNQWKGLQCEECDYTLFGGTDCDECAIGRVNYPTCDPACTVNGSCSGHAVSVLFNATTSACECECTDSWYGPACNRCDARFDQPACDGCAAMHSNYPLCTHCTNDRSCNGRAFTVSTDENRTQCQCDCYDSWEGNACDVCPPQYNQTTCAGCASGRVGYPMCVKCAIDSSCSGNAVTVVPDAAQDSCLCSCTNQWSGPTCSECPEQYAGVNCSICAPFLVGYPDCRPCTSANCSNNAIAVRVDRDQENCLCVCTHQWTGAACDECPPRFGGDDCDRCAEGLGGYPVCQDFCNVKGNCSDHAASVKYNEDTGSCTCNCTAPWMGPDCSECPSRYGGDDCDRCADSAVGVFPACSVCMIKGNCSGRASSAIPQLSNNTCTCVCDGAWGGSDCSQCDSTRYTDDCSACAEGRFGFPECRLCELSTECEPTTTLSAEVLFDACVCHCDNSWTGPQCSECPDFFDKQGGCRSCLPGFGTYPDCANTTLIPVGGGSSRTETLTLTPTPTLTLTSTLSKTETLEMSNFGAAPEVDDSCWTAWKGWCFWLLFAALVVLSIGSVAMAVKRYLSMKEEPGWLEDKLTEYEENEMTGARELPPSEEEAGVEDEGDDIQSDDSRYDV